MPALNNSRFIFDLKCWYTTTKIEDPSRDLLPMLMPGSKMHVNDLSLASDSEAVFLVVELMVRIHTIASKTEWLWRPYGSKPEDARLEECWIPNETKEDDFKLQLGDATYNVKFSRPLTLAGAEESSSLLLEQFQAGPPSSKRRTSFWSTACESFRKDSIGFALHSTRV